MNGFKRMFAVSTSKPTQLFKFLGVGVVNTTLGLASIYIAKWFFQFGDVAANVFGYSIGFCTSFVLNSRWTFAYRGPQLAAILKFATAMAVAYLANLATVMYSINYLGLDSYLAQAIGMPAFTIANYLLCRCVVFRGY